MGESTSARTERELAQLRAAIDADLETLRARLREDADPRRMLRRQPVAVIGALGSLLAFGIVTTVRSLRRSRLRRSDGDIDALIAGLGGRLDKLGGRARGRLREQLRMEVSEIETGTRAKRLLWESAGGALAAALVVLARRFAARLVADGDLPSDETSPR